MLTLSPPTYYCLLTYLFSDYVWLFLCCLFSLHRAASDVTPYQAQPLVCVQSHWDEVVLAVLSFPDPSVKLSASVGTTTWSC